MAKRKDSEPFKLVPIPGGPFDQFMKKRQADKVIKDIPKDSNTYLYNLVDVYGSDEVLNNTEVGIGDYCYHKGILHAMNMNVGRSIPWLDDGLKSVERRALFVMWTKGYFKKVSTKVASIVGTMISMVYPHGDRAPADTIYRLGRSKTMMIPYVQELSNYGNMEDLKPAAPRYAKAALSEYAYDCFFGDVGPKRPLYEEKDTYEYTGKEPVFLISRYPNILMQWNLGIGKGAMSWLGAFNSIDIFKATLALMDNPNAKVDIYPDTPVPVEIVNKSDLKGCFDRKQFKVKMQAPYEICVDKCKDGNHVRNKYSIVFTALPIGTTGAQIREEIYKIKKEESKRGSVKRLPEVLDVQCDVKESKVGPGGIRLIVEYEHGYDPNVLAEKLYKSTSLAKTVGVKYNLIIDNQPCIRTPREILLSWINQRYDQKRRLYHQYVLTAAKNRAMYEAMVIILATKDATDKAIRIIRSTKGSDDELVAILRKEFGLTEFQAKTVIRIELRNLSKMNIEDTIAKRDQAIADYKKYRKLLGDELAIKEAIREELKAGLEKYGRPRISKLRNLKGGLIGEPSEKKYLLYNKDYYFCFNDPMEADRVWGNVDNGYRMVCIRNDDSVLVFDQTGMLKILDGYSFTFTDSGISMSTLGITNVVSIVPDRSDRGYGSVVMVTEQGYGKAMEMPEVTKSVKSKVINLNAGDKLAAVVAVKSTHSEDSIVGMIHGDRMYYLKVDDFPVYKRASAGNRMIKGVSDLAVTNAIYFDASENPDYMLIYGESGYLKLLDAAFLPFSKRGNNVVSLQGKKILGAVFLHGVEDEVEVYGKVANGKLAVQLQIGKTVKFKAATGEEQRFKMSTSIGSPVKVLKAAKNEWYSIR